MKKRLISMLMAVLMIASLLPASAVFAADEMTACTHMGDVTEVSVKKDRAKKVAGVEAVICNDCGAILKSKDVRTVSADGVTITPFALFGITCNKCKNPVTVEVQAAGCGTAGLTVSYCADCGNKYPVEELASKSGDTAYYKTTTAQKHVYTYTDFHIQNAPTCQNDGWGYATCKNCNAPKFVANATNAAELIDTTGLKATQVAEVKSAVYSLYCATNLGHNDPTLLKAVTEETISSDGIELKPAKALVHHDTVNGKVVKFDVNQGKYVLDADAPTYEAGYTGDFICPDCKKGFPAKNGTITLEKHKIIAHDYTESCLPDKDHAVGKTDIVKCEVCGTIGGATIYSKSYWYLDDAKPATCEEAGREATYVRTDYTGKQYKTDGDVIPALGHDWQVVKKDSTCTSDGYVYPNYEECSVCHAHKGTMDQKIDIKGGHKWVENIFVSATCKNEGLKVKQCTECGVYETVNGVANVTSIPKVDKHVASDKLANVKEATCTEEGYTGDVVCKFCGEVMKPGEKTKMVDHTPVDVEAKAPTCTEPGISKGTVCKVCEKVLSGQETVPALGHDPKLVNAKDATCTEAGYTGDKVCTRCNVTLEKGKDIKALGHNFVKGVCSRCDAKQPGYNPFSDVKAGPYYDAILWAYENGVAAGKADGTFGVNDPCTRAQIVTFLWRAAGEPIAKNAVNPFSDVSAKSPYYNAILWAVENGITAGTTATTFSPNAPCTRAQIVTFLWRYENKPIVSTLAKFDDVSESSVYYNAIMWAVETGITSGVTKTTFAPNDTCTRGQAVTFIYREFASK